MNSSCEEPPPGLEKSVLAAPILYLYRIGLFKSSLEHWLAAAWFSRYNAVRVNANEESLFP
jgi:hypothetical protein